MMLFLIFVQIHDTLTYFYLRIGLSVAPELVRRRYAVRRNLLLADRILSPCQNLSKTFMLRSGEVETVEVHYFVPGRYEVMDKLLLRIRTSVNFS